MDSEKQQAVDSYFEQRKDEAKKAFQKEVNVLLDHIANLTKQLKEANLSKNQITNIKPLQDLIELRLLYLDGNPLALNQRNLQAVKMLEDVGCRVSTDK